MSLLLYMGGDMYGSVAPATALVEKENADGLEPAIWVAAAAAVSSWQVGPGKP